MKYNNTSFVIFLNKRGRKTLIHLIHDNQYAPEEFGRI